MPILCSCFAVGSAIAEKVLKENKEILEKLNAGEDTRKLSKTFATICRNKAETDRQPCGTCQNKKNGDTDSFEEYLLSKKQDTANETNIIPTVTLPTPSKRVA